MKRLFLSVLMVIFFVSICFAESKTPGQMAVEKFKSFFKGRGINVKLVLEKDVKIDNLDLKSFKFVIVELSKGKKKQKLSFLTDGKYMIRGLELIGKRENLISYYQSLYEVINVPYLEDELIFGKKDSKVKIVYFGDFECPFCKKCLKFIEDNYKDKVAVYFKHFPLSFHKHAMLLSKIYEAGKKMGINLHKFVETVKGDNKKILEAVKKEIPKDKWEKFKKIMDSKEVADKIKAGQKDGKKFGVRGTPTIFINGHRIGGCNPPMIKKFIENSLK